MNVIDSIVIVKNEFGYIATIRFENPKFDRMISSTVRIVLYQAVEAYLFRARAKFD